MGLQVSLFPERLFAHAATEDLLVDSLLVVVKLSHGHEDTLAGFAIIEDLSSAGFLDTCLTTEITGMKVVTRGN